MKLTNTFCKHSIKWEDSLRVDKLNTSQCLEYHYGRLLLMNLIRTWYMKVHQERKYYESSKLRIVIVSLMMFNGTADLIQY